MPAARPPDVPTFYGMSFDSSPVFRDPPSNDWFGFQAFDGLDAALVDLAVATAGLVLIFRFRAWAATLAAAGLLVLGAYGWVIAVFWPAVPGFAYGFSDLHNNAVAAPLWSDALQGSVLLALGLWLAPRVMRHHVADLSDPELAARAQQLTQRVQTLTQTRHDAVDTAASELRRIERDLHDGAQARLVALGMSLRAAERMFASNPEAALALVTEARETSSRALTDLRDLVRGIYPPVLADRGLQLHHIRRDGSVSVEDRVSLDRTDQSSLFEQGAEAAWRSTQSVSHRRRLSASSSA